MKIKLINKKEIWEKFVLSQHPNVFLQSWSWGEVHRMLAKKIFRLGLFEKKRLIGVALLIKEKAKRGSYFALPGGPILLSWQKKTLIFLFKEIRKMAQKERVIFIRVRPNIEDKWDNRRFFKELGFLPAPMYLHVENTLQLDLTKTLDSLLRDMRKNTRYSIRRAEREGVMTETTINRKDIEILYRLQMETARRHHFVPFSKEFFEKHFAAFLTDNQIALIKSKYKGEVLAIGMFVFYGDTAVYHYSGSSSKYLQIPASYAMLWRAIREAKNRGCKIFDLWGIAPAGNSHHRFAGVGLFKKGFGGLETNYLHARDLPLTWFYWLTYLFETLRKLRRGL